MSHQRSDVDGRMEAVEAMKEILQVDRRAATVAGNNGSNAIMNIIVGCRVVEDAALHMAMYIDKTRRHDHFVGIDGMGSVVTSQFAYGDDLSFFHRHIAIVPGITSAVDDASVADQHIACLLRKSLN